MKPIIITAIIVATATSAMADQATYDSYAERLRQTSYCNSAYDWLVTDHMETFIGSRGEQFIIDVLEKKSQLYGDVISIGVDAVTDEDMNAIERQRFQNNLVNFISDPEFEAYMATMEWEDALGVEATADIIFERCPLN
jgi:hypothetical protein